MDNAVLHGNTRIEAFTRKTPFAMRIRTQLLLTDTLLPYYQTLSDGERLLSAVKSPKVRINSTSQDPFLLPECVLPQPRSRP